MERVNNTPFETAVVPLDGPDGNPGLVIIIKGTFDINPGGPAEVAPKQIPVLFKDAFYDIIGPGSVKFESDLVPFKPRADIVLVGKAHAPLGRAVQILDVTLQVGTLRKTLRVYGDRVWSGSGLLSSPTPTTPKHFSSMELTYERAYGGIDLEGGAYCNENLVGTGCYAGKTKKIAGKPLPNIEDPSNLIKTLQDQPRPAGFGFFGKAWMPRLAFFEQGDPRQFNGAHPDLQVEGYLLGDEEVYLEYLSPEGKIAFQLPCIRLNARLSLPDETQGTADFSNPDSITWLQKEIDLKLDTLCIMPDEKQSYLVWRGLYSLGADEQWEGYKVTIS